MEPKDRQHLMEFSQEHKERIFEEDLLQRLNTGQLKHDQKLTQFARNLLGLNEEKHREKLQ